MLGPSGLGASALVPEESPTPCSELRNRPYDRQQQAYALLFVLRLGDLKLLAKWPHLTASAPTYKHTLLR